MEHGPGEARGWWDDICRDIEKKRGKQAVEELKRMMNAQSRQSGRESTSSR